jgi:dipeptidyl aminopeptidase/acylaminoacyl peptidase
MRDKQMAQRFLGGVLILLAMAGCDSATEPTTQPADSELAAPSAEIPLIDRSVFFDDPELAGARISPDGRWISFIKPYQGVMNIWVKSIDEPFDAARPLTADTARPVTSHFWSRDSLNVLYIQDKGGDENFHLYVLDPTAEPAAATGVPVARDVTPYSDVRVFIVARPEDTPRQMIVGLNDRNPSLHDVYRLNLDTGERQLLIQNDHNVAGWSADLDGNVRLATRQRPDGTMETLVVEDGLPGRVLYECPFGEACNPGRFHKDGKRVYFVSNLGEDLTRLELVDLATGQVEVVESDPQGQVDFGGTIFSEVTDELIATVYVGDRVRIYPRDEQFAKDLAWLREVLPDGVLGLNRSADDRIWVVALSQDVNPGSVYLVDREQRTYSKLYDSRPELPSEHLATMTAVRYPSRDGNSIPGYLVLPANVDPTNLPVIMLPHGGPWARSTWGYNSLAQFLANRGYAVMMPNFRGSTGYGKAFLNAGNGEWGTGIMQHDISDGVAYLIREGIADPDRVAIMGGSYGGYATLAGLAFTPELYATGVSIVGPSNIITLLNSIPSYWEPTRQQLYRRVGDPNDPADIERLKAQSPFYNAKNIQAPLLVVQGANDPRVKQAESDQIVVALRELERPVEYLVAPDEGHGFRGRENRMAMYAAIEKFLAAQLRGRYQEGAEPEVAERLAAITVDVDSVTMPASVGELEAE